MTKKKLKKGIANPETESDLIKISHSSPERKIDLWYVWLHSPFQAYKKQ